METQAISSEIQNAQSSLFSATAPLHDVWRQTWIEWPVALASESLRFAAHRLRAHSDFYGKIQNCGSVPEFIEAQSKFVRSAFDDYGTEATKVIKDATQHTPLS
ncbi:MAG TPA: phasin family protein [Methylovirgula sp.]